MTHALIPSPNWRKDERGRLRDAHGAHRRSGAVVAVTQLGRTDHRHSLDSHWRLFSSNAVVIAVVAGCRRCERHRRPAMPARIEPLTLAIAAGVACAGRRRNQREPVAGVGRTGGRAAAHVSRLSDRGDGRRRREAVRGARHGARGRSRTGCGFLVYGARGCGAGARHRMATEAPGDDHIERAVASVSADGALVRDIEHPVQHNRFAVRPGDRAGALAARARPVGVRGDTP